MNRQRLLSILLMAIFLPICSLSSQWLQSGAPNGGHTTCVIVQGTDLFASFDGGGVYRSTNDGQCWIDVTNNIRNRYVNTLFISGSYIYAGAPGIIYRSANKGEYWEEQCKGLPENITINAFTEIGKDLFIATTKGIFISKDQGANWKAIGTGLGSNNVSCLKAAGQDLYAGSLTAGIYKSVDKGNTWFRASAGLQSKAITAFAVTEGRILAGGTNGLYISYDNGGYWSFNEVGINQITSFAINGSTIIAGGQCNDGSVLAMSTNSGDSWRSISDGIMARNVMSIVFKGSEIVLGCKYTGLYITKDINSGWKQINNGIKAISVSAMVMDKEEIYCGTKGSGIFFSKDNGKTWSIKNNGLKNGFIETIMVKGSELYVGTLYGAFRSDDKGNSWKEILEKFQVYSMTYSGDRIFAGTVGRIYMSVDNCKSWYNIGYGIPSNATVNELAFKDKIFYAGTSEGLFMCNSRFTAWTDISKGLPTKNITAMAFSDDGIIAGTTGEGLWLTKDNGGKWIHINQNQALYNIQSILAYNDIIFVTSGHCIYRTNDMGKNWDCIADGLPMVTIGKIAVNSYAIFAGLEGGGIWQRPLCELLNHRICASVEPSEGGRVEGTGTYKYGSEATLKAIASTDYKFYNWSEDGNVISTDAEVTFRVTQNRCLRANFGLVRDTLTVLYVNDSHSNLAPLAPRTKELNGTRGGVARLATAIGMNRLCERNVLTLHAGDSFTGDLFFNDKYAGAEFRILQSLGLDAFALGNHELDITSKGLLEVLQSTFNKKDAFPFLSANLRIPECLDELREFVKPYTIKKVGSLRVGIFGMTTPDANTASLPSPAFVDTNLVAIANNMVHALKENKCDVIILLSHLGINLDRVIAQYAPGINIIVGGHDHIALKTPVEVLNCAGEKTFIVQGESHYQSLGKLKIVAKGNEVKVLENKMIQLDESIAEQTAVKSMVDLMIADIEKMYGPVYTKQIGTATCTFKELADSLTYEGNHDTPLGNLITDAFRAKLGTDIAIEASGSTSQPIYQGPIVGADVFRAIGYGFNLGYRMARVCISGEQIWSILEQSLATIEIYDELLPQVSGMQYTYNPNNAPGKRLLSVTINGKPLDPEVTYPAAANEFLVTMLQAVAGAQFCKVQFYDDMTEYQVVSEYIAKKKTISPVVEGRIVATTKKSLSKDLAKETGLPTDYQLMQNSPNPFNPTTTIEFSIPKNENVVLRIYNTLGQVMETLVNESMNAGVYKYTWAPKNLASGIYIYQLSAGKFSQAKKLILMK